jgi:hypothetical protein
MAKNFSDAVRDENLRAGRAAAEAIIASEVERLNPSAGSIVDAFSTRAMFAEVIWNEPESAARAYLAAAGAMLALSEGTPRVESGSLLLAAAACFSKTRDLETARAIAMLALRVGTLAGRDEVEDAARKLLETLGSS